MEISSSFSALGLNLGVTPWLLSMLLPPPILPGVGYSMVAFHAASSSVFAWGGYPMVAFHAASSSVFAWGGYPMVAFHAASSSVFPLGLNLW